MRLSCFCCGMGCRWYQLGQILNGMRTLCGRLKALQKAKSYISHARIKARWGRQVHIYIPQKFKQYLLLHMP